MAWSREPVAIEGLVMSVVSLLIVFATVSGSTMIAMRPRRS